MRRRTCGCIWHLRPALTHATLKLIKRNVQRLLYCRNFIVTGKVVVDNDDDDRDRNSRCSMDERNGKTENGEKREMESFRISTTCARMAASNCEKTYAWKKNTLYVWNGMDDAHEHIRTCCSLLTHRYYVCKFRADKAYNLYDVRHSHSMELVQCKNILTT